MNMTVGQYMIPSPHTIREEISLTKAMELMRQYNVRHLPVLSNGKVVGVLSERDIQLILAVYPHPTELAVGDAMVEAPYAVTAQTPLDEVLAEMGKNKYGCTLIKSDANKIVGIFTAMDAVQILHDRVAEEKAPAKACCGGC